MPAPADLDLLAVNTIRGLCMDAVQKANSGHPGTPMGMAPVAYTLWQQRLRFDPTDPIWPNRDRFVLSEGHASTLLWALLHLTKVHAVDPEYEVLGRPSVTLDDLKKFRQLDSHCPGHPEYRWTSGVEATTGPLGQGVATSVGMAVAGRWLAARYNRDGFDLFDYDVYALAGDGCMMEGISSEAASFAGHQGLHNLCWIYDSNRVTIEGHTDIAFTEDVAARFVSYGWNVTTVADANNLEAVARAFHTFEMEKERPTLILVHSHIGYGSPVEDSPKAHGEPLGVEAVKSTKAFLGMPPDVDFYIPDGVYDHFAQGIGARGLEARTAWEGLFKAYAGAYPELADEVERMQRRELPAGWDAALPTFPADPKGIASRDSSGQVLNAVAQAVPWVLGGSADLAPSTKTHLGFDRAGDFEPDDHGGRNFHFGIREHAATAITNGMVLSKLRAYWSGFLIFSDYARGAIRLSALMEIPTLHIFTHDSIGVGEDGPTHQPIEQLASLRAMPGLLVFRPADANEVSETWRIVAALHREPAALILSRQALPTFDRSEVGPASGVAEGAYVLADSNGTPDVILMATGSEVQLAMSAREELGASGIKARVVSMPCWELFERQPGEYRDSVLPPEVKARVAIEQASTLGWYRYVGDAGAVVGMHTFGASAPLKQLLTKFGFTPERVADIAREVVATRRETGVKATEMLNEHGQSLWLDNITRKMLDDGTIQRFVDSYSVTGLTSNPSIFDKAIESGVYDDAIRTKSSSNASDEALFFDLAIEDLRRAADMFRPIHERTDGVDGWVSLEVSPLLAYDTQATIEAAKDLHARADRDNLFIKIPGTPEGLPAITASIAAGVPVNVTLLFSADHYRAAADAFLKGIEQRVEHGLDPDVGSVASVFMSRWDVAVADKVPADLKDRLGLAVGLDIYRVYRDLMDSDRVLRLQNSGMRMQRLLWASTKTKDPDASDTLYVHGLAAPFTVNTMPDDTLENFYDHGEVGELLPRDGGDADALLAQFTEAGIDLDALAGQLQSDGAKSFVSAWRDLMSRVASQKKEAS